MKHRGWSQTAIYIMPIVTTSSYTHIKCLEMHAKYLMHPFFTRCLKLSNENNFNYFLTFFYDDSVQSYWKMPLYHSDSIETVRMKFTCTLSSEFLKMSGKYQMCEPAPASSTNVCTSHATCLSTHFL